MQTVLTICAVSADSLFAGFSVALGKKTKLVFPLVVAVVTFCLCCVACLVGTLLKNLEHVDLLSAVILAVIGLSNIVKKAEKPVTAQNLLEYIGVGFAVGTDAATSCVSLTLSTTLGWWLPCIMAVTHFVTVCVGAKLSCVCSKLDERACNVVSGVVLLCLALLKII